MERVSVLDPASGWRIDPASGVQSSTAGSVHAGRGGGSYGAAACGCGPGDALARGAGSAQAALAVGVLLLGGVLLGCAPVEGQSNRTFYADSAASGLRRFERSVPRLHAAQTDSLPAFVGVEVLGGVQLSRPAEWRLTSASERAGGRYVRYLSPNAYSFAIYDQPHWAKHNWAELLPIFEKKVEEAGSRVAGGAVPVTAHRGQGFAYDIRFDVPAAEAPLLSRSREWLLRADGRLVLVQVVRQSATFAKIDEELLQVLSTLRVR